jgi:hypothetical protein
LGFSRGLAGIFEDIFSKMIVWYSDTDSALVAYDDWFNFIPKASNPKKFGEYELEKCKNSVTGNEEDLLADILICIAPKTYLLARYREDSDPDEKLAPFHILDPTRQQKKNKMVYVQKFRIKGVKREDIFVYNDVRYSVEDNPWLLFNILLRDKQISIYTWAFRKDIKSANLVRVNLTKVVKYDDSNEQHIDLYDAK